MQLLAMDMLTGAYWIDVRKAQDPSRAFGQAATAAWTAFRQAMPLVRTGPGAPPAPAQSEPAANIAYRFLKDHPAQTFYPAGPPMPR